MQFAVLDKEHVGARAFGDVAAIVEHHGVGVASTLGAMLFDGADHVKARRLGLRRNSRRIRAAIVREADANAAQAFGLVEI